MTISHILVLHLIRAHPGGATLSEIEAGLRERKVLSWLDRVMIYITGERWIDGFCLDLENRDKVRRCAVRGMRGWVAI